MVNTAVVSSYLVRKHPLTPKVTYISHFWLLEFMRKHLHLLIIIIKMLTLIYKVAKAMALSIFIKKEILSKEYCTVGVKVYHLTSVATERHEYDGNKNRSIACPIQKRVSVTNFGS